MVNADVPMECSTKRVRMFCCSRRRNGTISTVSRACPEVKDLEPQEKNIQLQREMLWADGKMKGGSSISFQSFRSSGEGDGTTWQKNATMKRENMVREIKIDKTVTGPGSMTERGGASWTERGDVKSMIQADRELLERYLRL